MKKEKIKREESGISGEEIVTKLTNGQNKEKKINITFKGQKKYDKLSKNIHLMKTPLNKIEIDVGNSKKFDVITSKGNLIEVKSEEKIKDKHKIKDYCLVTRLQDNWKKLSCLDDRKFLMENFPSYSNFKEFSEQYNKKLSKLHSFYINSDKLKILQDGMRRTCDYIALHIKQDDSVYFYDIKDVEFSLNLSGGYNPKNAHLLPDEYKYRINRIFVCAIIDTNKYIYKANKDTKNIPL